jgi:hypothetical protein
MSQESETEKAVNPLNIRLESAGVLDSFNSLLSKYSIEKGLRDSLESVLKEHAPLSKKYHQGLIDLQREHRVSPDFIHCLGVLLGGVKTKTKIATKKKTTASKKAKTTKVKSKQTKEKDQLPVTIIAEVAGPTEAGLVLKVIVPWVDILSNIPPDILKSLLEGNDAASVVSAKKIRATRLSNANIQTPAEPKLSEDAILQRYQSAVLDPSPESMWDQVLHLVTGSEKVSLDRVAERLGSDKETIRDFLKTAYVDIKQYVEIRLEGDHVSATYK